MRPTRENPFFFFACGPFKHLACKSNPLLFLSQYLKKIYFLFSSLSPLSSHILDSSHSPLSSFLFTAVRDAGGDVDMLRSSGGGWELRAKEKRGSWQRAWGKRQRAARRTTTAARGRRRGTTATVPGFFFFFCLYLIHSTKKNIISYISLLYFKIGLGGSNSNKHRHIC